jgi:hypothetical protein
MGVLENLHYLLPAGPGLAVRNAYQGIACRNATTAPAPLAS